MKKKINWGNVGPRRPPPKQTYSTRTIKFSLIKKCFDLP